MKWFIILALTLSSAYSFAQCLNPYPSTRSELYKQQAKARALLDTARFEQSLYADMAGSPNLKGSMMKELVEKLKSENYICDYQESLNRLEQARKALGEIQQGLVANEQSLNLYAIAVVKVQVLEEMVQALHELH